MIEKQKRFYAEDFNCQISIEGLKFMNGLIDKIEELEDKVKTQKKDIKKLKYKLYG